MPDMTNAPDEVIDEDRVGFNLHTQKLHCLIMLNDQIGKAVSKKAGGAFFRAFIVENRTTGEILCNQRFRYRDGDQWYRLKVTAEHQNDTPVQKIEFLANSVESVMRLGLETLAGAKSPDGAVVRFYPPDPEDSRKTLDWLLAQDLVEITQVTHANVHDQQ